MISRTNRHGFAAVTAVVLLGLVSVALAILTTYIVSDSRRTRDTIATQQLQQLLFAGAAAAQSQLQSVGNIPATIKVPLPPELNEGPTSLEIHPIKISAESATIQVVARLGRHESSQSLTYTRAAGSWKIATAALDQ